MIKTLITHVDESKPMNPNTNGRSQAQNTTDNDQELRSRELQLIGTMLPGILHNMATPLSGVIGAAQLMESRVEQQDKVITKLDHINHEAAELLHIQHEKQKTNLDIIARNAKQLTEQLQLLINRVQLSHAKTAQFYSLCDVVKNEIKFLEADMFFKHKVRRVLNLSEKSPQLQFNFAHVVAVLDEFILQTVASHDFKSSLLDMTVTTSYTDSHAKLLVEATPFTPAHTPDWSTFELYSARVAETHCLVELNLKDESLRMGMAIPRS